MGDKEAEENTGMKDGMTREDNIPVNMFVGVATGTGGVLDESVDGKNPVGTDEDQGRWKPHASAQEKREEPWVAMAGRPWETEWALTTADNDCCIRAEIGVWMTWITEAKNSGEIKALAGVPDACMDVGTAVVVTEMVDAGAKETGGTELSKLFLVRQGGMAAEETAKEWQKHGAITPEHS